jgi:large subunit ribosomal protein L32
MAVQKSRKTPSRRGMRRSHDKLTASTLSIEPTTGETVAARLSTKTWTD